MNYTPLNLKRFNAVSPHHIKGPILVFISIILVALLAALLIIFLKDIL